MPQYFKQRRPNASTRNKNSGKKGGARPTRLAATFNAARTRDLEGVDEASQSSDEDLEETESLSDPLSSSEDEHITSAQSYAHLLHALKPAAPSSRPAKRRKLENDTSGSKNHQEQIQGIRGEETADNDREDVAQADLVENVEDDGTVNDEADSDDEQVALTDPFEQHYANTNESELNTSIEALSSKGSTEKTIVGKSLRKISTTFGDRFGNTNHQKNLPVQYLKRRLKDNGSRLLKNTQAEEEDIMHEMFIYKDLLCGCRSVDNRNRLRDISALHALNHIFKTRDKVLKHNAKMSQAADEDGEYRDQGFTRPKIIVLLPTKQACVRFVDNIVTICEPDQQENRNRFLDTFSRSEDDAFDNKPDDFKELFGGNHEEDFRVGLKFTRKTIKFFSGFYNSDIILASPLGLMRTITTGGGKKDSKKGYDADFLSSIEIVIMDQTNALQMQNWQHVDYVFSQLNLMPKESHGCDFARVRNWYLDGKAKYLRQTIIFSDYLAPSISALATTYLHNVAGRVKYNPTYAGAMLDLSAAIPLTITRSFLRFESMSPQNDSDSRFKFFVSTALPQLLRSSSKAASRGTIIYVPTYLDFVRLRNHFSTASETTSLAFGTISEYSSRGDVARARSHFLSGKHSVLLYSERAHHYFRYKIRGIRRIIFFGVPENPVFWTEMVDALGMNAQSDIEWAQSQRDKQGKGLVRAIFSKWDLMKLERIVGTERVGRLVSEREGDVFDFV